MLKYSSDDELNSTKISHNKHLKICQTKINIDKNDLVQTTRVGISKSMKLKWRWYFKNCRSISKREKGDKNPNFDTFNLNPLKYS